MTTPLRTQTFAGIVESLVAIEEEIAAEWLVTSGQLLQVLGWRGQEAWIPPSAWIDMQPSQVQASGGRVEDTLTFELWLTVSPAESENAELGTLVDLVDVALAVIDEALSRTEVRARLGVDFADRRSIAFRNARTAATAGDPGDVQALVITLAVRWPATVC